MTTLAVVLAAGGGTRFAGPSHKLLADFRGRPLARWAVDAAVAAGLDGVLVVTGAIDLTGVLPEAVDVVRNERWDEGQATSLAVAVEAAAQRGHDAIVVGLADQPLVRAEAWRLVAASASPIAVATYQGRRRNPVRLAAEVWPLLSAEGDAGARSLIAGRPDLVAEVACPGDPVDVDTYEELTKWS